jgi:DNA-binding PadR family transcriptional regulator
MSQVYSELERLTRLGLLTATPDKNDRRHTRRYRISTAGIDALNQWLTESEPEFPILKHPVALRLMMGGLIGPERVRQLLGQYLESLAERKASLAEVRLMLGDSQALKYPAMVADWGMSYYDSEAQIVLDLMKRLPPESKINRSQ